MNVIDSVESARRLNVLADFVSTVPSNKFCITPWVSNHWDGSLARGDDLKACLLGWATTIPEFAARGLKLAKTLPHDVKMYGPVFVTDVDDAADSNVYYQRSISAGANVFGVTFDEAEWLFVPSGEELIYHLRSSSASGKYLEDKIHQIVIAKVRQLSESRLTGKSVLKKKKR